MVSWFAAKLSRAPNWILALAIIAIQGSVQAGMYLALMSIFSRAIPTELRTFTQAFSLVGSAFGFVSVVLAWVLITHITHTIVLLCGADGSWRRLLEFIALCQAPATVGSIISAVMTLIVLRHYSGLPPQDAVNALLASYVHAVGKTIAQFGFLLSAIAMIYAVQANYRLSPWKARIAVAVPIAALLLVGQMMTSLAPKL